MISAAERLTCETPAALCMSRPVYRQVHDKNRLQRGGTMRSTWFDHLRKRTSTSVRRYFPRPHSARFQKWRPRSKRPSLQVLVQTSTQLPQRCCRPAKHTPSFWKGVDFLKAQNSSLVIHRPNAAARLYRLGSPAVTVVPVAFLICCCTQTIPEVEDVRLPILVGEIALQIVSETDDGAS